MFREYFRVRKIYEEELNVLKDEIDRLKIQLDRDKHKNKIIIKRLKDEIDDLKVELDDEEKSNKLLEQIVEGQDESLAYYEKILADHKIKYEVIFVGFARTLYIIHEWAKYMRKSSRTLNRAVNTFLIRGDINQSNADD
ncbi:MAG: hypothetical protein KA714_10235 [Limnoraphis sp. WC205]|nr:hypothetical protein [Limnoraphis sp. WC205]